MIEQVVQVIWTVWFVVCVFWVVFKHLLRLNTFLLREVSFQTRTYLDCPEGTD